MGEGACTADRDALLAATGRLGVGTAFGTFGELLQGVLPDADRDFLVTFPMAQWATATFWPRNELDHIRVFPQHKRKSARLAATIMELFGLSGGGVLELGGELAEGKGFASSSADLVATARAVGDAFGMPLSERTIESLLRQIEPSDGVMYDGVVAFYHREVRLRERIGVLPPLTVVAHDEGGAVDTIRFNRIPKPFDDADKQEYARLLAALTAAVRAGDLPAVGRVTTRSAELNGKLRPRRHFDVLHRLCREVDGYGLVIAHSGTALGVLLAEDDPERAAKIDHVRAACAALPGQVTVHRSLGADELSGGG
ncbi:kinase [Micromonospora lupini]|uniref:GHMP family kinase ATP-binding protein n=1 Tax=Micromonospora lupini TaxID=285679 RepID=UPI0022550D9A|nr:kinase [Micromonospora lupini]MCX5066821.1 kinase [Micromonospora lupini]